MVHTVYPREDVKKGDLRENKWSEEKYGRSSDLNMANDVPLVTLMGPWLKQGHFQI